MPQYMIQLEVDTEQDLPRVVSLAGELSRLAEIDGDVHVDVVAVVRHTCGEDDEDHELLVPSADEHA